MASPPDIFLSYNREDQAVARRFAEAFEREGMNVWWDVTLRSGEAYDKVTEQALRTAKAVVVLWSKQSVDSRWVRAEATLADRQHTLVPAMIEPCERPIMFELTQTADLAHWDGSQTDRAWLAFLADVKRFVQLGAEGTTPAAASPGPTPAPTSAPSRSESLSICVLPFANMSGDPEQEYFSDGISEDIITDLSKVSALLVIARNSAFAFKGKQVDIKQVARQLDVTHVLEGSVRKSGNRVRITAQLIDGTTNAHLWAERWDRNLDDIFALQDEISQAIVKAMRLKLLPEERTAIDERGTNDVRAYDLYLRGLGQMRNLSPQSFQRAVAHFREAVDLDPNYYDGWRGLAIAYQASDMVTPNSAEDWRRLHYEALEHARTLASDPAVIELVQGAQCMIRERDWVRAGKAMDRAAKLGPSKLTENATMIGGSGGNVGTFLACVGRIAEAIDWYQASARIDPLVPTLTLQFALDCAGRNAEAEAEYRRTLTLPSDPSYAEYFALRRRMATEDRDSVRAGLKRFLALGHDYMPIHAEVLERLDDREAVLQLVRGAAADPFYQDVSHMDGLAHLAAYAGDDALAVDCLRRAFGSRFAPQIYDIWHPQYRSARQTAGFKALVRDLGIYDYWRASGKWGDFARPVGDDDFEVYR
jgi:TolB-like protein